MHEAGELFRTAREALVTLTYVGKSTAHAVEGRRRARRVAAGPLTFVVGSPRSGTTFLGGALAEAAGMVDMGEVALLKRSIPTLLELPEEERVRKLRRTIEVVRRLAFLRGRRALEQTPETSFVIDSVLEAYPDAYVVHALRDGRDVVCSLLERGWLSAARDGSDDAGRTYGNYPRFWVEEERRDEFTRVSDATRAAWAWRRYVEAARSAGDRAVEVRYEQLASDSAATAERVAPALDIDPAQLAAAFGRAHGNSVGRWRRELTPEQVRDVEREAGELLAELGYV